MIFEGLKKHENMEIYMPYKSKLYTFTTTWGPIHMYCTHRLHNQLKKKTILVSRTLYSCSKAQDFWKWWFRNLYVYKTQVCYFEQTFKMNYHTLIIYYFIIYKLDTNPITYGKSIKLCLRTKLVYYSQELHYPTHQPSKSYINHSFTRSCHH